jgi:hypothetical protein
MATCGAMARRAAFSVASSREFAAYFFMVIVRSWMGHPMRTQAPSLERNGQRTAPSPRNLLSESRNWMPQILGLQDKM